MSAPRWATYESPIGPFALVGGPKSAGAEPAGEDRGPEGRDTDGVVLRRLLFPGHAHGLPAAAEDAAALAPAARELDAYFAGERRTFAVRTELAGTPFQRDVWALLAEVPFGATTSYGALALRVAADRATPGEDAATTAGVAARLTRAVAAAVARTPVPIVVPCHRVIGADGALTGYLGGLDRKRALLALERAGDPAALRRSWSERQLALL